MSNRTLKSDHSSRFLSPASLNQVDNESKAKNRQTVKNNGKIIKLIKCKLTPIHTKNKFFPKVIQLEKCHQKNKSSIELTDLNKALRKQQSFSFLDSTQNKNFSSSKLRIKLSHNFQKTNTLTQHSQFQTPCNYHPISYSLSSFSSLYQLASTPKLNKQISSLVKYQPTPTSTQIPTPISTPTQTPTSILIPALTPTTNQSQPHLHLPLKPHPNLQQKFDKRKKILAKAQKHIQTRKSKYLSSPFHSSLSSFLPLSHTKEIPGQKIKCQGNDKANHLRFKNPHHQQQQVSLSQLKQKQNIANSFFNVFNKTKEKRASSKHSESIIQEYISMLSIKQSSTKQNLKQQKVFSKKKFNHPLKKKKRSSILFSPSCPPPPSPPPKKNENRLSIEIADFPNCNNQNDPKCNHNSYLNRAIQSLEIKQNSYFKQYNNQQQQQSKSQQDSEERIRKQKAQIDDKQMSIMIEELNRQNKLKNKKSQQEDQKQQQQIQLSYVY